jgi:hypothetical protein
MAYTGGDSFCLALMVKGEIHADKYWRMLMVFGGGNRGGIG